jgi:ABC-type transporter Mla MlaB component
MLRITDLDSSEGSVLKLEGRVAGEAIGELRRVVDSRLAASGRLGLDLAAVTFVDTGGVSLLLGLVDRGVEIRRSSAFVAELLRAARR